MSIVRALGQKAVFWQWCHMEQDLGEPSERTQQMKWHGVWGSRSAVL